MPNACTVLISLTFSCIGLISTFNYMLLLRLEDVLLVLTSC
jgi:hypothetical protein